MQQVRADSAAGQDTVPTLPAQGESPPLPPLTEEQQREQVRKMNQWQAKRDLQELAARLKARAARLEQEQRAADRRALIPEEQRPPRIPPPEPYPLPPLILDNPS